MGSGTGAEYVALASLASQLLRKDAPPQVQPPPIESGAVVRGGRDRRESIPDYASATRPREKEFSPEELAAVLNALLTVRAVSIPNHSRTNLPSMSLPQYFG